MKLIDLTNTPKKRVMNIAGKLRKTSRLYYLLKKGHLNHNGDIINLCNQLDAMITVLNQVYKDNWDMYISQGVLVVLIRFKKIVISNNDDESHIIKELFVSFELRLQNNVNIINYRGTRAQRGLTEEQSSYSHSHLSKYTNLGEFGDFCYTSTEVYDLIAMFNSSFDINTFDLFLQTINTYVRHESLEGVPHIHIRDINLSSNSSNSIVTALTEEVIEEYTKRFFKTIGCDNNPIQYRIREDNFIEVDETYLRRELKRIFLEEYIDETSLEDVKKILVNIEYSEVNSLTMNLVNTLSGRYLERRVIKQRQIGSIETKYPTNNKLSVENPYFYFRGEKIQIKNYTTLEHKNYDKQTQSKDEWKQKGEIRNEVYEYVKRKFERYLNKGGEIKSNTF